MWAQDVKLKSNVSLWIIWSVASRNESWTWSHGWITAVCKILFISNGSYQKLVSVHLNFILQETFVENGMYHTWIRTTNKSPGYLWDISRPPTLLKMRLRFEQKYPSICFFPYFEKNRNFSKTGNFGRNITILSAFYIKLAAVPHFLKISFDQKTCLHAFMRKLTISFAFYRKFATTWS